MSELINQNGSNLIHPQVQSIVNFLDSMGLPSDNIIADLPQREIIGRNLPEYIYNLPQELKQDARYLSKFVVGAGFGLFDYALNSVWNEVVLSLRQKAIAYGIDYFFDNAVGASVRQAYQKEEDLAGLKDNTLLNTAKKLELISDTTYKKLSHILDMRNDIGISHPTNATINAFELLGWLQNCVEDVIQDSPSPAALQIKGFIDNLKQHVNILDQPTVDTICFQVKALHTHHCDNIIRTLFGLYVNPASDQILRKNISLFAEVVWNCCSDEARYNLGIILEGYNVNLHQVKYNLGDEFFKLVDGNNFRTKNEKIHILNNLLNELKETHYEWDNFYHEVPIAEKISSFISKSSDFPQEIINKLIRYILLCRVGKGTNYKDGVSPGALPFYNHLLLTLPDDYIPIFITELAHYEIYQKLSRNKARLNFIPLLIEMRKQLINDKFKEIFDYLISELPKTEGILRNNHFKKITSTVINWD
ncbi:hypothetical protein EGI15_01590 [Chryseobacterium cucumeris]|uniref:Uncharacterized protein n=3 Tax=Chryseobacterium cucumeris TaxID=1813611 RepID=A0ABX9XDN9_9FLAO|nr:hypothetical protein [Chryseobacterium cucumeris]ROH96514.1 hypothetical protein EGI15_01590 [Chryseobacterium cucumeris]